MDKKRALVIDDEQIVLDSACKILKDDGFEVSTTLSAGSGISHGINEPFDIILTDLRMPNIDGLKVLRDIRRFSPSVPILIITGYASVPSAIQAMKLGATHYIEKPFTPDQLINAVSMAIEKASGTEPEEETLLHPKEVRKVLKKGASDPNFAKHVFSVGIDALDNFKLTGREKLAIIEADTVWIEDQMGVVKPEQKQWLIDGKKAHE